MGMALWRETSGVNATTPDAKYIYEKEGLKTVSLVINGDLEYITKKKISVLPAPEEKQESVFIPEKPTWLVKDKPKIPEAPATTTPKVSEKPKVVPYINEDQLAQQIMDIARNGKKPETLAKYFCGDINKPVIANKKNSTFLILCEKIKDKKIKIKNLSIYRNEGSNCIKTITIDYKKGIF